MIKHSKKIVLVVTVVIFFLIVGLQVLKPEVLYHLLSIKTEQEYQILTMSDEGTFQPYGEELIVYILGDSSNKEEDVLQRNINYSLSYSKVNYKVITASQISELQPSPYHVLLLIGEDTRNWPLEEVQNFVQQGGSLFVSFRFSNSNWFDLVGIQQNSGFDTFFGIEFENNYFAGYPNISPEDAFFSNSMLEVQLKKDAEVYITAEDNPMLWTYQYGKGKIAYWNATFLSEKLARGLITHTLSLLTPSFVSGQAALKVLFIDDFPAPVPSGTAKSIERDFGLSTEDFYKQIWWPNMEEIAHNYNLLFTNVLIGTYRNDMELNTDELIKNNEFHMLYYGRNSLRKGHEIGFHGYNHQSLVTKNETTNPSLSYVPWESQQQMEESIRRSKEMFYHFFPKSELNTYVPPSNIINETGIRALMNQLPDLRNLSSLYDGDESLGDLEQEFEFDQNYHNLFHFPRISSGYDLGVTQKFILNDALFHFGMLSHFIHPDDVLDNYRSKGEGWNKLKENFKEMLDFTNNQYPHLRPYTASDAREQLVSYLNSTLKTYYEEDTITISGEHLVNPSHVFVRVPKGRVLKEGEYEGYEITAIQQTPGLYIVKLTKPYVTLEIKDEVQ